MTNTPEKIWRWAVQNCGGFIEYSDFPVISKHSTEYIRKDISDARIEHLEDEKDYLQAELSMAIKTAFHRGAIEWTKLNYPKMYKLLMETNK
jgi:uncharacterized protein YfaT (DUF1175 family)